MKTTALSLNLVVAGIGTIECRGGTMKLDDAIEEGEAGSLGCWIKSWLRAFRLPKATTQVATRDIMWAGFSERS